MATVQWQPVKTRTSTTRPATPATMMRHTTDEAKEGRDAFVQKRTPDFTKFTRLPFHG